MIGFVENAGCHQFCEHPLRQHEQAEGDVPYGREPLFAFSSRMRADGNPSESEIFNKADLIVSFIKPCQLIGIMMGSIDSKVKDIYRGIAQSLDSRGIPKDYLATGAHAASSLAFVTLAAFADYGPLMSIGCAALAVYEGFVTFGYKSTHEDDTINIRSLAFLGVGVPVTFIGLAKIIYGAINNDMETTKDGLNIFLVGASLTSWTAGDYLDRIHLLRNHGLNRKSKS